MLKDLRPAENPIDSVKAEAKPFFSPPLGRNPGRWCFSLTGLPGLPGPAPPAHLPAQALSPSSVLIIHAVYKGGDPALRCRQVTRGGRPSELFLRYKQGEAARTLLDLVLKAPRAQAEGPPPGVPVPALRHSVFASGNHNQCLPARFRPRAVKARPPALPIPLPLPPTSLQTPH